MYNAVVGRRIVYLARHGETDWNRVGRWQGHTDVPLSPVGRDQAVALGARLRIVAPGIAALHASDLSRATETALIVGRALGLSDVTRDPGLRERAFGRFEGLTRQECESRFADAWAQYQADPTRMPPGGEANEDVIERMIAAVRRAAESAAAGTSLLIVSHGGAIRALLFAVTGVRLPPIGNTALFKFVVAGENFTDVEPVDLASGD